MFYENNCYIRQIEKNRIKWILFLAVVHYLTPQTKMYGLLGDMNKHYSEIFKAITKVIKLNNNYYKKT